MDFLNDCPLLAEKTQLCFVFHDKGLIVSINPKACLEQNYLLE